MAKGNLFVVTAPSGAGKTSLVSALVKSQSDICVSVSHTTRAPRPGEVNGINYHFVTNEAFIQMLGQGEFLESAQVYGYHYGTSQTWVNQQLDSNTNVILEIDWQGAAQIRNLNPDACFIFILPPSLASLRARLENRGQDDTDTIEARMRQAVSDIGHVAEADYIVVNEEFEAALEDIKAIIRSSQLKVTAQQYQRSDLLSSLGKG
ncbi:MAG: guanylate kinase [Pseudohongiellaceae bacterium]|jgi:guanylate kinase